MSPTNSPTQTTTSNSPSPSEDIPSTHTTTIPPLHPTNHTHTFIFLHGREDFGSYVAQDLFSIYKSSDDKSLAELFPTIKFVFPTSKLRFAAKYHHEFGSKAETSLKEFTTISQWFDIWDINTPEFRQELMVDGLRESVGEILQVIKDEISGLNGVPLEKIVLGGISQGCAAAVQVLLLLSGEGRRLGGFVGVCSFLPFQSTLHKHAGEKKRDSEVVSRSVREILGIEDDDKTFQLVGTNGEIKKKGKETPLFFAHSKDDETVPFNQGVGLQQSFKDFGFDVEWRDYEEGGHMIHATHGVDDISAFLKTVLDL